MAEADKRNAKIETKGDAFVISAGFKADTINQLKKYNMETATQLVDKDTKDAYFKVAMGDKADFSKFGVTFTGANKDGYAEVTGNFPKPSMSEDEKKTWLRDHFAYIIPNLNKVQEQIEATAAELEKLISTVEGAIKVD